MAKRKLLFDVTNIICLKLTRILLFVNKFSSFFQFYVDTREFKKKSGKSAFCAQRTKSAQLFFSRLIERGMDGSTGETQKTKSV
jgi:hypothetical protein